MKYSEAIKLIKGLSNKYSIYNNYKSVFELSYEYKSVAWVDKQEQFNFGRVNIVASEFNKLPYSHKLWMILSELTMTPLNKREGEPRFYVRMIPGNTNWNYLNFSKDDNYLFLGDNKTDDRISDNIQTIFTESEYNELQQRYSDWLPKFNKNDPHFELVGNK